MLSIDFQTKEEGIQRLKSVVRTRDQMCSAMYWQICEDDCLKLADKLSVAGVDKNLIASIGGWELKS